MLKTAVINVVGLTPRLLATGMPRLARWAETGTVARIKPAFPAVTCTAQADYLTGQFPERHGIVANGWYERDDSEVRFWKQSNSLVQSPKLWDAARAEDPSFTVANLFWWFNMYSTADYAVTPRPMYPADGRKIPDVYASPPGLRDELQQALGAFPLFEFWGPRASIRSSEWIARAARLVEQKFNPTLTLIYLPHLDYSLQRLGVTDTRIRADLAAADELADDLVRHYESRGAQVIVLSEYGLADVTTPVHLNRVLREQGLLAVREELGRELLDPGASAAFAVADHQVAHVYVKDPARVGSVRSLLGQLPDVEAILGADEQRAFHVRHARAGELIAVAKPRAWFTYYYWLDDGRAPDYARTVDIHRKPGYDPVELVMDPAIAFPALTVGWKLLKRSLGFRTLLDVIPLDASLVRGSHGRPGEWDDDDGPVAISREAGFVPSRRLASVDVYGLILNHLRGRLTA
jgi:predicted AlkP superfamily pyrophosphatase or phosphodiesterase